MGEPDEDSESSPRGRLGGIHGVAALNGLWGLFVPLSAARFLAWQGFGARSLGEMAVPGVGWLWLTPLGLLLAGWATFGLYLREKRARWLSLAMAGFAVVVYSLHLVAALVAPEWLSPVLPLLMVALYAWPIWYLTRPLVARSFDE